jgi:nucleoside-diphosphate-sugar epimerase
LNWVEIDPLCDVEALARAGQGRAVILCLAGVAPGRPGTFEDNITLAEAAIRAGAEIGARVLLASSAAVYGNQAGVLAETAPMRPITAYGRAKAEMERRGRALGAELGVPVCSLRIGNIAGLDAILGNWRPGFQLDQFSDGRTPRRSYIGVQSLAQVLAEVAAASQLPVALNIAEPGVIEMGALLTAAGLNWTPQSAPESTIAEICLDLTALKAIGSLAVREGQADELVAQWRKIANMGLIQSQLHQRCKG